MPAAGEEAPYFYAHPRLLAPDLVRDAAPLAASDASLATLLGS